MIPDFQTLMRPILALHGDGEVWLLKNLRSRIASDFSVSEEERAQMLPSGRQRTFDNRVAWATTYLSQAGLVERPGRGQTRITPAGKDALRANPSRIDMKTLESYPAFLKFRVRKTRPEKAKLEASTPYIPEPEQQPATPTDLLEEAIATNRASVEGDVLKSALALSSYAFEHLVIELIGAMGYGTSGELKLTSASGDGGIDGIISQDPLGLDRIYVQAKRYAPENAIDRPRIQQFVGALLSQQGDRGVFITTSKFTNGAIKEAERINARVELIDGERLAALLVQYRVGVETERTVSLLKIDDDFFDNL